MIDHESIAPPPSLADILSGGDDRIGRVDFGGLAAEGGTATATRPRPARAAAKPAPKPAPKLAPKAAPKPVEPAAEATAEAEKAEATAKTEAGEKPAKPKRTRPRAAAKATLRPTLKRVRAEEPAELDEDAVDAVDVVEEIDEVEDLDDDLHAELEPQSFTEPEDESMPYAATYAAPYAPPLGMPYADPHAGSYGPDSYADQRFADPYAAGRLAPRRQLTGMTAPSNVPEEDVAYLGLSVEEVAESARARMRAAEAAHLRHLEAIENEAARRLELLTAQAELDAELIRLHARREAHAIVTAARTRTGAVAGPSRSERRLSEVGGAFSRFAESLDGTVESQSAPDHRRRP